MKKKQLEQEMAALFAAKTPFLIVDTETTGFLEHPDGQIIEISIINQDGEILFTSLVKPDAPVGPGASKAHGLYDADLASAPTFVQLYPELMAVLTSVPLVYAYNVPFDRGMILKTAKRFGLALPDQFLSQEWRCMMSAYAEYHGDWSEYHGSYTFQKLSVACTRLGAPISSVHRATGDCLNTLALMRALAAKGASVASQA